MANKKVQRQKKYLAPTVSLVGEIIEKGLLVLVFTVIATLEKALALTSINDSNFHSAIETCLGTNPVDGLCSSSEYGSMPDWDVSMVTDMHTIYIASADGTLTSSQGFGGKTTFNGDIRGWNTSQVTSMGTMFESASSFNQDIGGWNTAQVTDMNAMFNGAKAFNQDIGGWNTEKVTDMGVMFQSASSFNRRVSSWTGTAATTAQTDMFSGATAFLAKYTCGKDGPASSCDTIRSDWVDPSSVPPSPPPSSSSTTALTGLLGLISASVVAFVLV